MTIVGSFIWAVSPSLVAKLYFAEKSLRTDQRSAVWSPGKAKDLHTPGQTGGVARSQRQHQWREWQDSHLISLRSCATN